MMRIFAFRGRAPRMVFWWTTILLGAAFTVLFVFFDAVLGYGITLVLYPPFFWILLAVAVRRMRDRGRSPAWLLAAAVPVIGPLWLLLELGLLRGTPGENQYGANPLEAHAGYLTVKTDLP